MPYFAEIDGLGLFALLVFLVYAGTVAIVAVAVVYFVKTVIKKTKVDYASGGKRKVSTKSSWYLALIAVLSLSYLLLYLFNPEVGPLLGVVYLVVNAYLFKQISINQLFFGAGLTVLVLAFVIYNHYPQYTGRNCDSYPSFLECRMPRHQF